MTPVDGWELRVKADDKSLDIYLGPSIDYLHDVVMDVSRYLPRFEAWIVRPECEPENLNLFDN